MNKPTVFFSHSSKDRDLLIGIKKYLTEKTGNSVSIFVSSDGQSIPLGRNWVHKVQESLEIAQVMFVFISPDSMSSQWIHFEAGYAYSKNIKVIPVGIDGIDLGRLPPPISLLQGFNITSSDGVNNIIAIINSEFGLAFKEDFDQCQYERLFIENRQETKAHDSLSQCIEEFTVQLRDDVLRIDRNEAIRKINALLENKNIPFQEGKYSTRAHGWSFRSIVPGGGVPGVEFVYVPELTSITLPHMDAALSEILAGKCKIYIILNLYGHINGDIDVNRISAKLFKYDVELGPDDDHVYKGMHFEINRGFRSTKIYLRLSMDTNDVSSFCIPDLMAVLFDSGVLWTDKSALLNECYEG